jgi:hypothetical protein
VIRLGVFNFSSCGECKCLNSHPSEKRKKKAVSFKEKASGTMDGGVLSEWFIVEYHQGAILACGLVKSWHSISML